MPRLRGGSGQSCSILELVLSAGSGRKKEVYGGFNWDEYEDVIRGGVRIIGMFVSVSQFRISST